MKIRLDLVSASPGGSRHVLRECSMTLVLQQAPDRALAGEHFYQGCVLLWFTAEGTRGVFEEVDGVGRVSFLTTEGRPGPWLPLVRIIGHLLNTHLFSKRVLHTFRRLFKSDVMMNNLTCVVRAG
jgi:hypothetical protein